jgi:hypothetical protein
LVPVYATNRDRFSEMNRDRPPNGTNGDQCLSLIPIDKPNRDRCNFSARPKTHFLLVWPASCLLCGSESIPHEKRQYVRGSFLFCNHKKLLSPTHNISCYYKQIYLVLITPYIKGRMEVLEKCLVASTCLSKLGFRQT